MSCRVMGRYIEDQLLGHLVEELRAEGVSTLRVRYLPTKKNEPARAFVERLSGGRVLSEEATGARTLEFAIGERSPVTQSAYAELVRR